MACPLPAETMESVVLVGPLCYSNQSFPRHNTGQHILVQPLLRNRIMYGKLRLAEPIICHKFGFHPYERIDYLGWRMVNSKLCETARRLFSSVSPRWLSIFKLRDPVFQSVSGNSRRFVRKPSTTQIFFIVWLQSDNKLPMSEVQKNWGVTDIIFRIKHMENYPNFLQISPRNSTWPQCLLVEKY